MNIRLFANRLITIAGLLLGYQRWQATRRRRWYAAYMKALDGMLQRHPDGLPPHLFIETTPRGESATEEHQCVRWAAQGIGLTPEQRAPIIRQLLAEVHDYFARHHLEYWLDSGTLLGAFRNGKLIPWDDDGDIMMRAEVLFELLRVAEAHPFRDPECVLVLRRSAPTRADFTPAADAIPAMLVHAGTGVYIDLFIAHGFGGSRLKVYWRPPCHDCRLERQSFPADVIFPLGEIELEGRHYPTPHRTREYLIRWYGDLRPPRRD